MEAIKRASSLKASKGSDPLARKKEARFKKEAAPPKSPFSFIRPGFNFTPAKTNFFKTALCP